jgi:hypothetical protein
VLVFLLFSLLTRARGRARKTRKDPRKTRSLLCYMSFLCEVKIKKCFCCRFIVLLTGWFENASNTNAFLPSYRCGIRGV